MRNIYKVGGDTYTYTYKYYMEVVNMETTSRTVEVKTYQSSEYPDIYSQDEHDIKVIEFIDTHPVIVDIVKNDISKAFGAGSSVYIGWAQENNSMSAILEKVRTFMRVVSGEFIGEREGTIWNWRAHFTLDHYNDKGFKGGFFQCHDRYPRGCMSLDYTPETLPEVVKWFYSWAGNTDTQKITIDGKEIPTELWRGV